MDKVIQKLQVFFEDPFWVGIFELIYNNNLSVCKVTFGAEPKDYEVQKFILENYYKLTFSPSIESFVEEKQRMNPKRLQREVKKEVLHVGLETKSQQALKLQQEEGKLERRHHSRERIEEEKERQFELRQQKKKEKHRGR